MPLFEHFSRAGSISVNAFAHRIEQTDVYVEIYTTGKTGTGNKHKIIRLASLYVPSLCISAIHGVWTKSFLHVLRRCGSPHWHRHKRQMRKAGKPEECVKSSGQSRSLVVRAAHLSQ